MPQIDIFSKINMSRNTFTKVEQRIADYVLKNYKEILYMSITDLAAECNVGDTSVFRFCKTLKFHGYQEFKMYLAQSVDVNGDNSFSNTEKENGSNDVDDMALKVLDTNISALNETYSLINYEDIKKAVNFMLEANKICFFGVGSSLLTAMTAKSKFMRIMSNVECTYDSHLQAMQASLMTPKDLAFIISYSGSTKDVVEIAKICKNNSVKVVCITRFLKSPLKSYADLTLLCGANEGPLQGGSVSAMISQLYLFDILYTEYLKNTYEVSKINREKTSSAIIEKMY
jgi:DNA-binding MurR/RpiR family transcriptional regulator